MAEYLELFKTLGFPVAGYITIFATMVVFIKKVLAIVEKMLEKHDRERAEIFAFMQQSNKEQAAVIKENTEVNKRVITLLNLVYKELTSRKDVK